ncbi:MAG: hypothetical protein DME75_10680 [Verrucomicrobia bacterium]|nr:MAG: hypothetical protein DME87_01975 [Verrucomicrobiota bacterium]PYJ69624.1 MAG: hypothetical protein DME75_10680 [Verrucomicrobiota bacterium]
MRGNVASEFHSGERTRLACRRARPRARELFLSIAPQIVELITEEVRFGEPAKTSTRAACAPQIRTAKYSLRLPVSLL